LIFSDGLVETTDPQGDEFGQERSLVHLRQKRSQPAQDQAESLLAALQAFSQPNLRQDDITLVVIRGLE
jgi:serine phosphatase RsbU (regulator of sigma subunit)